ncbi:MULTISPECIES: MmyB family transcriptional regulator [unclassified Saccharothrix]|uniref:MmyB family transcriptional regulator n=1 Tax=unclassified Saccharothrix TaxID=2593673 RepID=UPI00307F57FA
MRCRCVLAHISTEYYVRLEQGRAPRPSAEVLAGIAGALRLTDAESDHLHVLAGTAPSRTGLHRRDVRPSILALLERLPQTAAFVISATFEVLAWNDLAAALMEDPVVGPITVDCDTLTLTDRDQHLVLYSAPPNSPDAEALALLNVLGAGDYLR